MTLPAMPQPAMTPADLRDWIVSAAGRLDQARDELTELDAATGDGDLGVTVASGAREVVAELSGPAPASTPGSLLRAAGGAFARGNPSSFAALTGAGLLAAAVAVDGSEVLDRAAVVAALQAAADKIAERGRATVGQRTVLDALVPSIAALQEAPAGVAGALGAMVDAARAGAAATAGMTPARGRALWVGERARGVPDGGATAYVRFLEALAATAPAATR